MKQGQIGDGDVPITIDGDEMVLRPSFLAAQTISRQAGGIMGAIERTLKVEMDTIMQVVTLGLGYGQTRRPPPDLPEKIWRSGFTDDSGAIVERCVTYLRVLANGGRMPKEAEGSEEAKADPPSN